MPQNGNVRIVSSDSNDRVATIGWVDSSITTYTGSDSICSARTFNSKVEYAPEIWETPNNPYYDYVSDLNNILKNVKIQDSGVYVNDEFASYRVLSQVMNKICDVYNRYKNIKTYKEPSSKGDEYNE